jgi:hypothetical protein
MAPKLPLPPRLEAPLASSGEDTYHMALTGIETIII